VGGGKGDFTLEGNGALVVVDGTLLINFRTGDGQLWALLAYAPSLVTGKLYQAVQVAPVQDKAFPGLKFFGDSRSCSAVAGSFTLDMEGKGLRVTFTQYCERKPEQLLRGSVVFTPTG